MLMRPSDSRRAQLMEDLISVRDRLEKNWLRGGFVRGESVCIVAACAQAVGADAGSFHHVSAETTQERDHRLGRLILTIYRTLYGPKADLSVPLYQAEAKIAEFNDTHANHGAVLLLLDRAIALCMEPVAAPS